MDRRRALDDACEASDEQSEAGGGKALSPEIR
jgi:hypothetical protein